jgi:hypothetical protein
MARIDQPSSSFFSRAEAVTAGALIDRLLALDDEAKRRVLQLIDEWLAAGQTDGWRSGDRPGDGEVWRTSLAWLDADADDLQPGHTFAALDREAQIDLLEAIHAATEWHGLAARRVWCVWTRDASAAFFSGPMTKSISPSFVAARQAVFRHNN